MLRIIEKIIKNWTDGIERSTFGVCDYLGEKMRLTSSRVRLYFIYASFITFGSPLVLYLVVAFWMNIRRYFKRHRDSIFG